MYVITKELDPFSVQVFQSYTDFHVKRSDLVSDPKQLSGSESDLNKKFRIDRIRIHNAAVPCYDSSAPACHSKKSLLYASRDSLLLR